MVVTMLLVWTALYLVALSNAHGQTLSLPEETWARRHDASAASIEEGKGSEEGSLRMSTAMADFTNARVIVIGFVGGFVKHDDSSHPEVLLAARLRARYNTGIYAEVFGNHSGRKAFRQVMRLLDGDRDGVVTAAEKEQARVIIYGHSWGASETIALARELNRKDIPVWLTIQVDSIAKPGQPDSTIPPNVANAVNFYQPRGLFRGRSEILVADSSRTRIIGNYRMVYKDHPINCDNAPWYARVFMKPHIEIENDPRVWEQAEALIDSGLMEARDQLTSQ
jgi:hypothetical protein